MTEPVTLPVACAYCHEAVTLQFGHWKSHNMPLIAQTWTCPYCQQANTDRYPGRLAWATKREDESSGH
jgi:hypothetical protein